MAEAMKNPKVKDYMSPNVITVSPEQTVEEVIKTMRYTDHDGFPVVDGSDLIGIITTRDLIMRKRTTKVRDAMSRNVVVTYPETYLTDAARVMFRMGFSRLPVVNENKKLVGIITNTDVIRSHIERATPDKVQKLRDSLEKLYDVKTEILLTKVKIPELIPTQNKVHPDEFRGREYEIKRGLAEPIVVVKTGERFILVDGHHRALAALKLGINEMDAYVVALSRDIELGLEKTAKTMGLRSLEDIQVVEEAEQGIAEVIGEKKGV